MDKLISALFDFSFRRFATPTLIRFVYGLLVALAAIAALGQILLGFQAGLVSGVIALIAGPLTFVLIVCVTRLGLEAALNVMRIANYTGELARAARMPDEPPRPPAEEPIVPTAAATLPRKSGF